ncbi:hypothetical protein TrCOL_g12334 [Triparma columacea]|uniref:Uncharacterized protein n=1 Tax=Triparma columacea TaxID=722753 RepID=A0A9W7LFQ0_9STRA|nr:hypothetical protein TrCOL_g12334 [Triparma columacea]
MESIRAIQELVDEHKEKMPTGVVTSVMEGCQKAYNSQPKLYQLTWTMVDSSAHIVEPQDEPNFAEVKLTHKTQTLTVEAVDYIPRAEYGRGTSMEMPHSGIIFEGWLKKSTPFVEMDSDPFANRDHMVIIHSIVPFKSKRAREE